MLFNVKFHLHSNRYIVCITIHLVINEIRAIVPFMSSPGMALVLLCKWPRLFFTCSMCLGIVIFLVELLKDHIF